MKLRDKIRKIPRIFRSKVFISVLLFKLILSFLFGSDFLVKGTIPFVNYFVESQFSNPYDFFFSLGHMKVFPYPPMMLYLFTVFRFLLSFLFTAEWNLIMPVHLFVYRLPIVIADILIYYVLVQLLKPKEILVTLFYWCSPILIYINYIHGQLDVIPIALLFLMIYFIYRNKFLLASITLGMSIATKTHIVLVFPVFFVYLWKQRLGIKKIIHYTFTSALTYLIILLPFVFSKGLFYLVFMAEHKFRIFNLYIALSNVKLFIIPALFFVLYLFISTLKNMNKQLLMMVLTLIFTLLVTFISPMPGWYYWSIPFIVYFIVKEGKLGHYITYGLLNFFYVMFFAFNKNSDIFHSFQVISSKIAQLPTPYTILNSLNLHPEIISNILITFLTSTLVLIVYWIYTVGVNNNIKYNLVDKPLIIGICGDSSSGKTTLKNLIASLTGTENITTVSGDDIHKWERGDKNWERTTHLNPLANELYLNLDHARKLMFGSKVDRRKYDHNTGKFTTPQKVYMKRFMVFEGLHQFIVPGMRDFYDIKIFMDIDENLRKQWKLKRDMKKRSYSKANVLKQLSKREKDSKKYIRPQKEYADILIKYIPKHKIKLEKNQKNSEFSVTVCLKDHINIEGLYNQLNDRNIDFKYSYEEESFNLFLTFDAKIPKKEIREIAFNILPNLRDVLNNFEPEWSSNNNGIIQIILLMYFNEKILFRK